VDAPWRRFLKRQLSLPVSKISQWWVRAVEQSGGHFGITCEDTGPFAEGEICSDENRGSLIQAADQMKEQLPARLSKGQIARFVEDGEVRRAR
jgi:hypothetical protein